MYADLIKVFAPLAAFMLLPIWIPIITAVVGRIADSLRGVAEVEHRSPGAARARTGTSAQSRSSVTA